ncbi:hypothetical protein Taro_036745, partial [Colocasia esculenta]|nr:hypothetical protein [Colocasia esculenta]
MEETEEKGMAQTTIPPIAVFPGRKTNQKGICTTPIVRFSCLHPHIGGAVERGVLLLYSVVKGRTNTFHSGFLQRFMATEEGGGLLDHRFTEQQRKQRRGGKDGSSREEGGEEPKSKKTALQWSLCCNFQMLLLPAPLHGEGYYKC